MYTGRTLTILATIALLLGFSGCDTQSLLKDGSRQTSHSGTGPINDSDTIRIASFNIQVFGTSKMGKPDVMQVLAKIIRRYDIVAVQELRAADQTVVPKFVQLINAEGANYKSIVGPRLGRTSSKEQYVYLYDANRIELVRNSVYTVPDPQDLLHREPLVASFRVRGPPSNQAFTFKLVNIHTDPDETDTELDALADVFQYVQRDGSNEDDVILLGDLNVDEYHLGRLGELPGIAYAISGLKTNTRGTKSYDNIVFNRQSTAEYRTKSGVLNLMTEYNLTQAEALKVSDHMPVWAAFSIYEGGSGPVASRPETNR